MNLLTATLVFMTIGCAYSQNIDFERLDNQLSQDIRKQLHNLNNQMSSQFNQLGNDFDKQFSNIRFTSGNAQSSSHASQVNNVFMPIIQQMMGPLQTKCQSAGHPEVPELIENEKEKVSECLQKNINVENLQNELGQAMRTNDLPNFFKKVCGIWPATNNCIKPILSMYKLCLSSNEVEAMDKSMDLLDVSYSFFCDNNAEHITDFLNNNGLQCFDQSKVGLQHCVTSIVQKRQNSGINNAMVTYDEAECSDFQEFRGCLVDKLRQCPSSVPSQILDDYFGVVYRKACNSASTFTWLSFVNIVLLLVTYLYSKMF